MQTIVLAAGRGTRMQPLTDERPKPMLPVADRPLLAHVLDAAVDAGASRFVVVVGYESEAIREFVGEEYRGIEVEYAVQGQRRGTADAVLAAREHLEPEPFVVLNGDVLVDAESLSGIYAGGPAVGAVRVDEPSQYGVLLTEGEDVSGVVEKPEDPPSELVNAGAYAFPAGVLEGVALNESERGEYELTDVLGRVARDTAVRPVPFDRWMDVGRPWELLAANETVLGELDRSIRGRRSVSGDAELRGDVVVEEGATVEPGAVIEGPAMVRDGATVGPNAYVRGPTLVGEDASVGHAVEVKNSVLMEGASVSHLSYVGDSVLGRDVNFGAGTNVANLRHDEEPVRITVKNARVSTGRRKFGVVCGDRVKTGINTSINVGVTLSTGAHTAPGEVVTDDR